MGRIIDNARSLLATLNSWTQKQSFASMAFNGSDVSNMIVQTIVTEYSANVSIATVIPRDDTIPQVGEGTQIISQAITPKKTGNKIRVRFSGFCGINAGGDAIVALFVNGAANAVRAYSEYDNTANAQIGQHLVYEMTAASTAAITFSVRSGPDTNATSLRWNGTSAARYFGGVAAAVMTIEEFAV